MAYKCRICGSNDVENPRDICELCAISQDPYASSISKNEPNYSNTRPHIFNDSSAKNAPYTPKQNSKRKMLVGSNSGSSDYDASSNDEIVNQNQQSVPVYSAGQSLQQSNATSNSVSTSNNINSSRNQPISVGITKNITVDNQKKSIFLKWFRTLFLGIPFTLDDEVTMFQVFPDYSGTSLNALGNACDQIILYGKLNQGVISENNDVEVYGRRDSHNNVIAKTIKNKASGTTVSPIRTIGAGWVWLITIIFLCILVGVITFLGPVGIVWGIVIILCLTNLPLVIKIIGVIFGMVISFIKKLF